MPESKEAALAKLLRCKYGGPVIESFKSETAGQYNRTPQQISPLRSHFTYSHNQDRYIRYKVS